MIRLRFLATAVALVVATSSVGAVPSVASGQEFADDVEVRITARRLADGYTELALQQRGPDGAWGERMLSTGRFFPAGAPTGHWVQGPTLTVAGASTFDESAADVTVRIVARLLADGRIELAVQQLGPYGVLWGERLLPTRRFFPAGPPTGRWLSSSPLTITIADPERDAPTPGGAAGVGSRVTGTENGVFTLEEGARSGDTLVAASNARTCAVRLDGGLMCWGWNGLRDRFGTAALYDVVAVSIGDSPGGHACVLHGDGTVSCWGSGYDGALGQGDSDNHYLPVKVQGIEDAVAVAAGTSHTCAAHADGGVSCWGRGNHGQLGHGTREGHSPLPQRIPDLADVRSVAAGPTATCALHLDGTVSCWGWPVIGDVNHESPRRIEDLDGVASVALGWRQHCAVRTGGQVYCWNSGSSASQVRNISDVADVAVGNASICALHRDGGVSCWGENRSGELGDGTTTSRASPARLPGISDAVAITASVRQPNLDGESGAHACVVHENGSVSCWGNNADGQLGDGTYETRLSPTRVRRFERLPPDRMPRSETLLLRAWGDEVVKQREAEFPWLRVAWDHIRERTVATNLQGNWGGAVISGCGTATGAYECWTDSLLMSYLELGGLVHELAHVYDMTTGLAPGDVWGAVQLYFATTYADSYTGPGSTSPKGSEILADTVTYLVAPRASLTYYLSAQHDPDACPALPDKPSREAQEVVRAGLAGRVPDWYTTNITNGAELWAAVRRGGGLSEPLLANLANLANEFGGLCTTDWLTQPLDPDRLPAADTNPFRDGGC